MPPVATACFAAAWEVTSQLSQRGRQQPQIGEGRRCCPVAVATTQTPQQQQEQQQQHEGNNNINREGTSSTVIWLLTFIALCSLDKRLWHAINTPHAACSMLQGGEQVCVESENNAEGRCQEKPKTYFARPAMSFDDRQSTDGRVRERDKEKEGEGRRERGREKKGVCVWCLIYAVSVTSLPLCTWLCGKVSLLLRRAICCRLPHDASCNVASSSCLPFSRTFTLHKEAKLTDIYVYDIYSDFFWQNLRQKF